MKQQAISIGILSVVFSVAAFGQTPPPPPPPPDAAPRTLSGGVLNGKALSLPRPPYPPAARAVNAEGPVTVQVLIDENGEVVSASAVSGHPLLRSAAVSAARQARFAPTLLAGSPVKVTGVITYNFVGAAPNITSSWYQIAFDLGFPEASGKLRPGSSLQSIANRLPQAMTEQKSALERLEEEALAEDRRSFTALNAPVPQPTPKPANRDRIPTADRYTVIGDRDFTALNAPARQLNEGTRASLRSIGDQLESAIADKPRELWVFQMGRSLGRFLAVLESDGEIESNIAELRILLATAGQDSPSALISRIEKLIEDASVRPLSDEIRSILKADLERLRNIQL